MGKWFCLERDRPNNAQPFKCPECRQDHFLTNSTVDRSSSDDLAEGNSINQPRETDPTTTSAAPLQAATTATATSTALEIETRSVSSDYHMEGEECGIPDNAFVCIGKAISGKDAGYDFLSDAGSEDRSSSAGSPRSTPKRLTASGFHMVPPPSLQQANKQRNVSKNTNNNNNISRDDSNSDNCNSNNSSGFQTISFPANVEPYDQNITLSDIDIPQVEAQQDDGEDYVTVGSIISDGGKPLQWK